jgi:hypothetical protein
MAISKSTRYGIDGAESAEEWRRLLPEDGHTTRIDEAIYTVTMFHQLKCLDLIREEYVTRSPIAVASGAVQHCMNYLRQTLLCHPNLTLEKAITPVGEVETRFDTVCRDWTKLYDHVEQQKGDGLSVDTT